MFGFRKKKKPVLYLLTDSDSHLLAKGDLQNDISEPNLQMKIIEGQTEDVVKAEFIQVLPSDTKIPILMGKVIFRRGNAVVLEPMRKLGEEVRRNFRMPVAFESFLYPYSGGRAAIRSIDLSCGGIAFFSPATIGVGEDTEIVIPITSEGPLIVRCEILRYQPYTGPIRQYAAKFVNLIHDEEALIMEAVFNVQIESIRISKKRK